MVNVLAEPEVIIAGFGDEYSYFAEEHLAFLGERSIPISLRFVSFDDDARLGCLDGLTREEFSRRTAALKEAGKIKHVTQLTADELDRYKDMMHQHGVGVWDIGSAVGKQYLGDPAHAEEYQRQQENTIRVAHFFGTPRVRMFNFYPGRKGDLARPGTPQRQEYAQMALGYIQDLADLMRREALAGFLEVETELLGHDGASLMDFWKKVGRDNIFLYFDGANMVRQDEQRQGLSLQTYNDMVPGLGGLHIKDAVYSRLEPGQSREEAPWPHVPVGQGDADYELVLQDFRERIHSVRSRLEHARLPGYVGVVLEPHLKAPGQFGGFTGSLYQKAVDALVEQLGIAHIGHQDLAR